MTISAIASSLPAPGTRPGSPEAAPDAAAAQRAGAQFEAILVRQLLAPAMTGLLGSERGAGAAVYGDMLTDTIAQQLTAGPGLGLGHLIASQLGPRSAPPPAAPRPSSP